MENGLRYKEALQFAMEAHAGAFRKGTNIPYIEHAIETSKIAAMMTDDEDVIIAALLHDVIEDTDRTAADIEKHFGSRVASLVTLESENKRRDRSAESTWLIRKQETIDHLKTAGHDVKLIALADKLSNMRLSLVRHRTEGDDMWKHFNEKSKERQAWYYRSIAEATKEFANTALWKEYVSLCDEVFG